MNLHENKKIFIDAIRFTSQQLNIKPEYIEKDYWVTFALFTIFKNELGKDVVFKGGTALSKCYHLIDRFSEDIDLVVLRHAGESDSQLKNKLKNLSTLVETIMIEVDVEGITNKKGMNRKTAHTYNKEFKGSYGQIRDVIVIESSWLGHFEPYTSRSIVSFIGNMMIQNGQTDLAVAHNMLPFELKVLEPSRTICEKIMSLVRFSYGENPISDLKKKIRHTYDIHQLLDKQEFSDFLNSKDFEIMLLKVANDDIKSFKNNNQWLTHHPKDALFFKNLNSVWEELIPIYYSEFKDLVYGKLPDELAVFDSLKKIKSRLQAITWSINLNIMDLTHTKLHFTEEKLEQTFTELLGQEGFPHQWGVTIPRRSDEVIIEEDLFQFLMARYQEHKITENECRSIILKLKSLPASDLYESNKTFMHLLSDGFILKREDRLQKDIFIELINYFGLTKQRQPEEEQLLFIVGHKQNPYSHDTNIYKFVTQFEIVGSEKRIPDGILYINGLPVVVFEFKSAIREEATIHDAFKQLTIRYRRDIPELFKYNAFCVISDGINNKVGSFFAPYEFFYAWRRVAGLAKDVDGIDSMFTLIQGMFHKNRLRDIIRNFIYIPDSSKKNEKIVCRYPQYYAARALYENIKKAQKPDGNGKGGTYFGATGCGKSFTMLYLTRLLMKSAHFESPTIIMITDRTDLDDQLSGQFTNAKNFIGDNIVISVESRAHLRELLQFRQSGGVFLTTIHKFTEDTELLTDRTNVICISDEAHRSQLNLDQKIKVTEKGVAKTFGFAKYLHNSLPNATFVGFTGTPIDATLDVFGKVVDAYTMTESVKDEITVRIVYEGRASKVALNNSELEKIEKYYEEAAQAGANIFQIDQSKEETSKMDAILGDPKVLNNIANDFVNHYEQRVSEGSTVKGKAMFVCSSREIAYELFQNIIKLRPEWNEIRTSEEGVELTDKDKRELKPIERIKLIATRGQDDIKEMYDLLGTKEHRKELDRQFKNEKSNFKIAIVVDMWLTGFDVPFLDSIYIYKPIQQHNLIQTISRVNRKFEGKNKGLVVDYIGIKKQMNLALAKYNKGDEENFEDIAESLIIVRNHLDLLAKLFHTFDYTKYFKGTIIQQLNTLNLAAEFAQKTKDYESRFMGLVKRLKAAYDICSGSELLTQTERDYTHFYLAVRSIIFKLTKGNAPDTAQMNAKVREMIKDALQSDGVEEIFKLGDETESEQDIFDKDYLAKIDKIKLPNTKIKLLQQLLAKVIGEMRKVNRIKGIDFSKKMQTLVERYNNRDANDILRSEVYEDMANALTELIWEVHKEFSAGDELGIDFEEKAFYDILKELCIKYDFRYPDEKMIQLAKAVKELVDGQAKYPDWNKRDDIKSALKVGLILLLDEFGYPPVERDEVYVEIFEQAENFKKNQN